MISFKANMCFEPNGMLECWKNGKMGFGLRLVELTARRGKGHVGLMDRSE